MNKIISVVMPIYNAELYIEECIESVLKQSFKNFEFIIIDDGSTDKSLPIIKKYMNMDERIILVSRENKGLIFSLNEGLYLSKGKYIARMDGDDICFPNRLRLQYDFMVKNQLDICGGDYFIICEKGKFQKKSIVPKKNSEILLSMTSNVPFAHPSVMLKKKFLIKNKLNYGKNGHRYAEDLDLWFNMYSKGAKFGNIDKPTIKYRQVHNSLSSVNHLQMKLEVRKTYNLFVYQNHKSIKKALEQFCQKKSNDNNREKEATRALLSYLALKIDLILIFQFLKNVSFLNFIVGFISYINSKVIIKWIK